MKNVKPMTATERSRKYRQRLDEKGGRRLSVHLSPEGTQALEKLQGAWDKMNTAEIVAQALIIAASERV